MNENFPSASSAFWREAFESSLSKARTLTLTRESKCERAREENAEKHVKMENVNKQSSLDPALVYHQIEASVSIVYGSKLVLPLKSRGLK